MTFEEFCQTSQAFWDSYIATIGRRMGNELAAPPGQVIYYPTTIMFTELPDHFALELLGLSVAVRPLTVLRRRVGSTDLYLGSFAPDHEAAVITVQGDANITNGVALVSPNSVEALERRFPGVLAKFSMQVNWGGPDSELDPDSVPVRIANGSGFVQFEDAMIVNSYRGIVRLRHFNLSIIVGHQKTLPEYTIFLEQTYSMAEGQFAHAVRTFGDDADHAVVAAAQFANVFLMDKVRETSIGAYLADNRDLLLSALNGTDMISEPYLEWQVASPDLEERAINPDLFLRNRDGYWDVYDLKLPLLRNTQITVGERRRRRFIATVEDGIAQLAHYRDFLSYPDHLTLAKQKYGVDFLSPRFGLIVGNDENIDAAKVDEAMRRLERFDVLDYDTIMKLYLAERGAFKSRSKTNVSTDDQQSPVIDNDIAKVGRNDPCGCGSGKKFKFCHGRLR